MHCHCVLKGPHASWWVTLGCRFKSRPGPSVDSHLGSNLKVKVKMMPLMSTSLVFPTATLLNFRLRMKRPLCLVLGLASRLPTPPCWSHLMDEVFRKHSTPKQWTNRTQYYTQNKKDSSPLSLALLKSKIYWLFRVYELNPTELLEV